MLGHLSEKADVFSFGVVALEIVSGRSNADLSFADETYLLERVSLLITCLCPLLLILKFSL